MRPSRRQIIEMIHLGKASRPGDMARLLSISPQALHRHLKALCAQGTLKKVGEPPQTRYQMVQNRPPITSEQSKVISEIGAVLGAHPAVLLVTLFGSFARGQATPDSDIDVLVWLSPDEPFDRKDLWDYWDRQTRHVRWAGKVSLVTRRWRTPLSIETLLLDLPEEHILVFDRKGLFPRLVEAVIKWRTRNGASKTPSFGGKHGWKYSSRANRLDEIDFELEIADVT